MAKVLVVGGAGYIGSSVSAWLLDHGHEVVVLDDLSTGHRELALGHLTVARAGNRAAVRELLERQRPDCVMHFAAKALVAESWKIPEVYIENNVDQTRTLIDSLIDGGVNRFIFSSTCAIFGDPQKPKINEHCPKKPRNPYGESKVQAEAVIEAAVRERGLKAVALRYFNAAGIEPQMRVGEMHNPETHLIPNILKAALNGQPVPIFGTDYSTPDGTCVRDYIHVCDLAAAHESAMKLLLSDHDEATGRFERFNLGSEHGYSVRDLVSACEKALGRKIKTVECDRRPGDPPHLVADSTLAKKVLGFQVKYPLEKIVETALQWEQRLTAAAASNRKAA